MEISIDLFHIDSFAIGIYSQEGELDGGEQFNQLTIGLLLFSITITFIK